MKIGNKIYWLLWAGLIVSILGSLLFGAYAMSSSELVDGFLSFSFDKAKMGEGFLLYHIRLPRVLLAALVGAGLASVGAAIQGLFRNPLADPTLIGVSSGAVLFAVLTIVLTSSYWASVPDWLRQTSVSLAAFAGGVITTFVVYAISKKDQHVSVMTMLLAGIAISALASAIVGICIYLSDDQQLRDITFWTLGSLSGTSWLQVVILSPLVLIGLFVLNKQAGTINALLLGEKEAAYLGVKVENVKTLIILIAALITGVCISFTGIIGFVGLIIPHFLRLVLGSNYTQLLPSSAILGAVFLVITDTLARTIVAPAELPLGIITALIGAPFFLWLIYRTNNKQVLL
jgi:iron complex transport system permease protein